MAAPRSRSRSPRTPARARSSTTTARCRPSSCASASRACGTCRRSRRQSTALGAIEGCSAYLRVLGCGMCPPPSTIGPRRRCGSSSRGCGTTRDSRVRDRAVRARLPRAGGDRLRGHGREHGASRRWSASLWRPSRWELGSGMALERGDLSDAPAEAVWASGREDEAPNAIVTLTLESRPEQAAPLTEARMAFRKLLSAVAPAEAGRRRPWAVGLVAHRCRALAGRAARVLRALPRQSLPARAPRAF